MSALSARTAAAAAVLVSAKVRDIIVRDRLRRVLPDRVETLQVSYRRKGIQTPIELVLTDEGPRLVYGAHRLATVIAEGDPEIPALLYPAGAFGTEDDIREREIAENFDRFELNALERAVNIAEWRAIYERANPPPKRGRRASLATDEVLDELSAKFALNFPEVVQRTLGLSRRAVFLALKVASIGAELRDAVAQHPIANNQSELLALAAEPAARQAAIVGLLTAQPATASSVADAIAIIDNSPPTVPLRPHERLADSFSRLRPAEQDQFFDLHADAIARWQAKGK